MKFAKTLIIVASIFILSIPAFASNHHNHSTNLKNIDYLNNVGYAVDHEVLMARGGGGRGGGMGAGSNGGYGKSNGRCMKAYETNQSSGTYGPGDGTGKSGNSYGPGDGTGKSGNGFGPGDGTGNNGDGPKDGTGNGPKTGVHVDS